MIQVSKNFCSTQKSTIAVDFIYGIMMNFRRLSSWCSFTYKNRQNLSMCIGNPQVNTFHNENEKRKNAVILSVSIAAKPTHDVLLKCKDFLFQHILGQEFLDVGVLIYSLRPRNLPNFLKEKILAFDPTASYSDSYQQMVRIHD